MFGALTPLYWFFEGLSLIALGFEGWALIDAVRRPASAFLAAGKQTKPLWLVILSVAAVIGAAYSLTVGGIGAAISILPIVAFVAAAIYLTDVRPKVRGYRGGSGRMGPYGPW